MIRSKGGKTCIWRSFSWRLLMAPLGFGVSTPFQVGTPTPPVHLVGDAADDFGDDVIVLSGVDPNGSGIRHERPGIRVIRLGPSESGNGVGQTGGRRLQRRFAGGHCRLSDERRDLAGCRSRPVRYIHLPACGRRSRPRLVGAVRWQVTSTGTDVMTSPTTTRPMGPGGGQPIDRRGVASPSAVWADFSTGSGWSRQLVGDFNDDGRR